MAIGVVATGCYDVPKPQCGFRCGAAGCPDGYTCGPDDRCRLVGAPADLVCADPDAGPPADAYSPFASRVIPLPGETLDPEDPIIVQFDTDVGNVSAATFTVTNLATAQPLSGTILYNASVLQATFLPDANFPETTPLQIYLDDAIAAVATGRTLLPTTFDIMTGEDTNPPEVAAITPAPGTTGVDVDTDVRVRFSEAVSGVSGSSFTLADASMTAVAGTVVYDAPSRTATFQPTSPLAPGTTYTLTLTSAIADAAGNALVDAPVTSSFTTAN